MCGWLRVHATDLNLQNQVVDFIDRVACTLGAAKTKIRQPIVLAVFLCRLVAGAGFEPAAFRL